MGILSGLNSDFHLLSKPFEHTSAMVTSNLNFSEWLAMFDDAKMTTAQRNRLTCHFHIMETGKKSHRFGSTMDVKARIKAREGWPAKTAWQRQQHRSPTSHTEDAQAWEYAVLVTNSAYALEVFGQLYRDRADCENGFDELNN